MSTYPEESLSVEAQAFRRQEQIQEWPSYEMERRPSQVPPEGLPQGVPPPVGSREYNTEYNTMLQLGLTTTQVEAKFRRRLKEWDQLNMSFGQNIPSQGLAFGRNAPPLQTQMRRSRSKRRSKSRPGAMFQPP